MLKVPDGALDVVPFGGGAATVVRSTWGTPDVLTIADGDGKLRSVTAGAAPYLSIADLHSDGRVLAWVQAAPPTGDGPEDTAWEIRVLVDGQIRTAVSGQPPSDQQTLAVSYPWLAWSEVSTAGQASPIEVVDLRSGVARAVGDTTGALVVAIEGQTLWYEQGSALWHRPLDGRGRPVRFLGLTRYHQVLVSSGWVAWMENPDELRPETGTLRVTRASHYRPVVVASHRVRCTPTRRPDGSLAPCGDGSGWGGWMALGNGFIAWEEPARVAPGLLVAAPLGSPAHHVPLTHGACVDDWPVSAVGATLVYREDCNADGTTAVYVDQVAVR